MVLEKIKRKIVWRRKRYSTKEGEKTKVYYEWRLVLNKTLKKDDHWEYYIIRQDVLENFLKLCDKAFRIAEENKQLRNKINELESRIIELKNELEIKEEEYDVLLDMFAKHLVNCLKIDKETATKLIEHDMTVKLLQIMSKNNANLRWR